ncbi:MAG: tetratricopeptide repeat protein [Pseudomonadota bacterium]
MADDNTFNTVTMAGIYAKQGLYDKAAEIYNKLLEQNPDRDDLVEALSELDNMRAEVNIDFKKRLIPLFREWFDLMLCNNRIKLLERLKNSRKF